MSEVFVVVLNVLYNRFLKFLHTWETHPSSNLRPQYTEPDFDLIQPRAMARRVEELNSVARVGQERFARSN